MLSRRLKKRSARWACPAPFTPRSRAPRRPFRTRCNNEPYLILAALVAVYIVLGILYESLIHPLTILSTLPPAGVGAILALLLTGTDLSIIALIGIILLIGIVKKNAIMMIDFALQAERDQGLPPVEAIYQACLLRFRPIMMTTMAALFGGMPLAIGMGVGSELRKPLGITIVGGLMVSQTLTLFTTPVVYLFFDKLQWRVMKLHKVGVRSWTRLRRLRKTRQPRPWDQLSRRSAALDELLQMGFIREAIRSPRRIGDIVEIHPDTANERDFSLRPISQHQPFQFRHFDCR